MDRRTCETFHWPTGSGGFARGSLWAVLVCAALGACASTSIPSASIRPLGPGETWLRSIPPSGLCAGGGTVGEVVLHGSPSDSLLVWLTMPDGKRRQLSWRPGTSARFAPTLEVIGPDGRVIAQEGSAITGTCAIVPDVLVAEFGTSPFAEPDTPTSEVK